MSYPSWCSITCSESGKIWRGVIAPLSTTPSSLAIQDLAARVESLENAVREIAK
jgi:hypothetical protein